MTNNNDRSRRGAYALTGKKRGIGWLPWLLLALLLLLAIGTWLLIRNSNDDDDAALTPDAAALTTVAMADQTAAAGTAPIASNADTPATADDGGGATVTTMSSSDGASGSPSAPTSAPTATPGTPSDPSTAPPLTANGQDVVALAADPTKLATLVGSPASGRATVESVVSDEGFWIGSGPTSRVFVLLTPDARGGNGESPFQVAAGQTILLEGTANTISERIPSDITDADGKSQLQNQNFVVDVTSVALATP